MDKPQIKKRLYLFEIQNGVKARIDKIISFKNPPARSTRIFFFHTRRSLIIKRNMITKVSIDIGIIDKLYPSIKHSIGLSNINIAGYK